MGFFTKRERGDGGNSGLAIRTSTKNDERTLILQEIIPLEIPYIRFDSIKRKIYKIDSKSIEMKYCYM